MNCEKDDCEKEAQSRVKLLEHSGFYCQYHTRKLQEDYHEAIEDVRLL